MKFIKGRYEEETVRFFEDNVKKGFVCYDIGGHVGYMSLILAKLTGNDGQVIVFEPRPINISYIEKHISVNNISNVRLLTIGLSAYKGTATFDIEKGTGTGRISEGGTLTIEVDSLDNLFEKGDLNPPNFIKMDIEGEELKALKGSEKVLNRFKPILNISTHGAEIHKSCIDYVRQIGYSNIDEIKGGFTAC